MPSFSINFFQVDSLEKKLATDGLAQQQRQATMASLDAAASAAERRACEAQEMEQLATARVAAEEKRLKRVSAAIGT
jgi:uncharacterized protein involved in exopolysaccharide biosynthesis